MERKKKMRKFEIVNNQFRKTKKGEIKLPTRADVGSAGYDFYTPIDFTLKPGETKIIATDVKVNMNKNEVLLLFIRSSIGIKRNVILSNCVGVIDSTYYSNSDNDGNICGAFTNLGTEVQKFKAGDRVMQGVFVKYLTTKDDKPVSKQRTGGIGSSGK